MLNEFGLQVVTEDGTPLNVAVLESLIRAIDPLLAQATTEIRIQLTPSANETINISISYEKAGAWHLAHHEVDPSEALSIFARIRVLAGMSIVPAEKQTGKLFVHFGGRLLILNVTLTTNLMTKIQALTLTPQWAG